MSCKAIYLLLFQNSLWLKCKYSFLFDWSNIQYSIGVVKVDRDIFCRLMMFRHKLYNLRASYCFIFRICIKLPGYILITIIDYNYINFKFMYFISAIFVLIFTKSGRDSYFSGMREGITLKLFISNTQVYCLLKLWKI